MPRNKWTAAALLWFAAGTYALIFRESSGSAAPPFPHFDKIGHFLLFFAQIWLAAKAWLAEGRTVPVRVLLVAGLILAAASETAQHLFTQTRRGDIWDAAADLAGTCAALTAAKLVQSAKNKKNA